MHILYLHQHFSTPSGSTGTRSYEMAQKLIAHGHKVTIVCGNGQLACSGLNGESVRGKRHGVVDGINVIEFCLPASNYDSFLKRTWVFLLYAFKSMILALRLDYDLLFATSTPLTAGIPGVVMKLFRRKPFVFEVRDLWPELPREMRVITNPIVLKLMDILELVSYYSADKCIGLSPGIVSGIIRRNIPVSKVNMIPNGCDIHLFVPIGKKGVENIDGIYKGDFIAIFCGTHGTANGLDSLLDAAKILKERREDNIKLLFIGDGKLKPLLVERKKIDMLDNCIFCEPLPKYQVAKILAASDVGMMALANVPAFYYGTSPNKFFDYIAAGLPILINYPGWLAEIVKENNCGISVPPGDPISFADALVALRDDATHRVRMGKNSRSLAESHFNREDLADSFVTVLEETQREYSFKFEVT